MDALSQNTPNAGMMFTMYTPIFGNGSFAIDVPKDGKLDRDWPSVPYLSLEALIYEQMSSNPFTSPNFTYSGQSSGQQGVSGTYTMQDANRQDRYMMGFQQ